ncbi:hypothetical protein DID88_002851 [Monilinia fructigena]|uniref:Uncharacterized protein n=1 Tax=Monilinia fructigena TaxID=38457 RepID=A0A395IQB0_9HELO|nr:hypothetical protein DID88_002851 [Monilinia fructigena]
MALPRRPHRKHYILPRSSRHLFTLRITRGNPDKNKHGLPTFKIAKRQDYDFSFQGIPIFEFSTRKLFAATSLPSGNEAENGNENNAPIADFLSVDGLEPYEAQDPYHEFLSKLPRTRSVAQHFVAHMRKALDSAARPYKTTGR